MSTPVPWYGTPSDWSQIISGAAEGTSSALRGMAGAASSKQEAKEAKRRTLANLMNQSMKRNQRMFKAGQDYSDDINDFQSQALQQVARGFVDALSGSTNRG